MWDALRLDVRHSARSLRRARTFSAIVIVTLALAVGATRDARSAGRSDAASTVTRKIAAATSSVRGSWGAMP